MKKVRFRGVICLWCYEIFIKILRIVMFIFIFLDEEILGRWIDLFKGIYLVSSMLVCEFGFI